MVPRPSLARGPLGWAILLALFLSVMVNTVAGLNINYCSSQLTADDEAVDNPYQSNGACQTACKGKAFAILKGHQCWCSNYAPGQQGDTGDCNSNCPGFPAEKCGSPTNDLYAYFQIGSNVAGTAGVSSAPATTRVTASTTPSEAPTPTPPSITVEKSSPTVTVVSTPAWTATPFASVTTVFGSVQTVIITPSPPAQPAQTDTTTIINSAPPESFWSDTGKVAGTFVAVALVIIIGVAAAIFFMLRRMRRRNDAIAVGSNAEDDSGNPYMVDRRRSNLTLTTNVGALARGNSNEKPGSQENTPATLSRRTSMPLVHDQRLNPAALWSPTHDNGSHISVGSFRDDQDYSRPVLHVRNPDSH